MDVRPRTCALFRTERENTSRVIYHSDFDSSAVAKAMIDDFSLGRTSKQDRSKTMGTMLFFPGVTMHS